jgi:hypothetical protein
MGPKVVGYFDCVVVVILNLGCMVACLSGFRWLYSIVFDISFLFFFFCPLDLPLVGRFFLSHKIHKRDTHITALNTCCLLFLFLFYCVLCYVAFYVALIVYSCFSCLSACLFYVRKDRKPWTEERATFSTVYEN